MYKTIIQLYITTRVMATTMYPVYATNQGIILLIHVMRLKNPSPIVRKPAPRLDRPASRRDIDPSAWSKVPAGGAGVLVPNGRDVPHRPVSVL